ncbi:hypothetical protein [Flectobacillus roseus]|uniref:hypothetical protein n=1 Tax=Flectobacillus roseus TaxID=502259 RepID=UPI0024B6B852|nr:hypothetical protein [Flectobacillus roseus]MDI9871780.1 hypothetical protein [Flectobacillus roseus]
MTDIYKLFPNYSRASSPRPSRQTLIELIDKIQKLDLATCQIPYIRNLIDKLTDSYTLRELTINPNTYLFRGIIYSDKPSSSSQLSYPPEDKAKINRASKSGQQMFYSATDPFVPFYELGAQEGDRLVISRWKVNKKLHLNSVGFTDENFKRLNSLRNNFVIFHGDDVDINHPDNILVHKFLTDAFSQFVPKDKLELYRLTIAIAESLFEDRIFDGLAYPTIPMNANADNVILKPVVVDSGAVSIDRVTYNEVTNFNLSERSYRVKKLDYAETFLPNGFIEWTGELKDINS